MWSLWRTTMKTISIPEKAARCLLRKVSACLEFGELLAVSPHQAAQQQALRRSELRAPPLEPPTLWLWEHLVQSPFSSFHGQGFRLWLWKPWGYSLQLPFSRRMVLKSERSQACERSQASSPRVDWKQCTTSKSMAEWWEPWTLHPGSFVPHVSGLWGLCLWILPGIRNAVINTCLRIDMETAPSRNSDFMKYSSIQETAPLGRHFLSNKLDQRGLSSRMLALVCLFLIAALSCTPKATQCAKQYLHVPPPLRPSQKPSEFVCGREGRVINLAPPCLALISFWLKQNRAKLSFVSHSARQVGFWSVVLQQIVLFLSFHR